MVDTVRNMYAVLKSLGDSLRQDTRTKDSRIVVMERVNDNPDLARGGWIGVYVERASYDPRTAGAGARNWNAFPVLRLLIQASDLNSTLSAYERLETYIKNTLDVVLANTDLRAAIDGMLQAVIVEYNFSPPSAKTLHYIGAVVTLTYESRSN